MNKESKELSPFSTGRQYPRTHRQVGAGESEKAP